jgi:hypothetical protein
LKRVDYPLTETITAVESLIPDLTARQTLSDIYRSGAYSTKWIRANGHSSTNGSTNGVSSVENGKEPDVAAES